MSRTAAISPTANIHNTIGVAPADLASFDDDTSYGQFGSADYISFTCSAMPAATGISSLVVSAYYKYVGPGAWSDQYNRLFIVVGGVTYYGSYQAASSLVYATQTETWILNPATGLPWTQAQINAIGIGVEYSTATGESSRYSALTGTITYIPLPASVDVTRQIGSVALWLKKRPEAFLTFDGNLDLLNLNLLDMADVEHTAGPHATDKGWEGSVWQRRPFEVHEQSIDLNTMSVSLKLKDQRPIRCLVRDLAWSDKASGSIGDGIARFSTPGSVWTFTRGSEHTLTNPVGESETVPTDIPAYGPYGLFMLSASGGRAAPRYKLTNNTANRTWLAAQGGFVCEVYLDAVSGAAKQTVAYAYHDASNWHHVYWDGPNARWVFEVRAAGTTYRATKSASPSANTVYQIGARWTGSNLELGATAYTLSVWVDRVKGTDAVAAAAMTETASAFIDFGSKAAAGTEQLNGQIRKMHVFQYVPSDEEMARQI